MTIRPSTPAEIDTLFDIWQAAVQATHDFVLADDLAEIATIVREQYLPNSNFVVVVTPDDTPIAFMGMTGSNVDSVFVAPDSHGRGAGRALIEHARNLHPAGLTVDVNEGNLQAVGFYEHLGFRAEGRSPLDGLGKAYPILHMQWP